MIRQALRELNLINVDVVPDSRQVGVTAPAVGAAGCISAFSPGGTFVSMPTVSMEHVATIQSTAALLVEYLVLADSALAVVLEDDGSRWIHARSR